MKENILNKLADKLQDYDYNNEILEQGYESVCEYDDFCAETEQEFCMDTAIEKAVKFLVSSYALRKKSGAVVEEFKKQQACENVRAIYRALSMDKARGIKDNYNDILLYFDILKKIRLMSL